MSDELTVVKGWIDKGYTVMIRNPFATTFNEKYTVIKMGHFGGSLLILDEQGRLMHEKKQANDH